MIMKNYNVVRESQFKVESELTIPYEIVDSVSAADVDKGSDVVSTMVNNWLDAVGETPDAVVSYFNGNISGITRMSSKSTKRIQIAHTNSSLKFQLGEFVQTFKLVEQ